MAEGWSARRTVRADEMAEFGRPESGLSMVAVLTPVNSQSLIPQTRIVDSELLIGRGEKSDGVGLQVADVNVSRFHARISKVNTRFILEDLNSSNGTYVDGVPIRSTVLHNGDTIQIGTSLVYFDRLLEFGGQQPSAASAQLTMHDWYARRQQFDDRSTMSLRFWGTRGSLPTPGADTSKFGGNTTCLEVRYKDCIIVLDAGSGIREMSLAWAEEFTEQPVDASLCFTHLHWDHIQGFPFFGAAYQPKNTIQIYGAQRKAGSTKELLSAQMQGDYFPIPLSAMKAGLEFHETKKAFEIGEVAVETFALPHPSGSLGYRFSAGNSVFVMATDSELDQVALNQSELSEDFLAKRKYDPAFLQPFLNADLLAIDCQYSDDEYRTKTGWGHNSIAAVVDLCSQVRPKMVALTHHDPMSTDDTVSERVSDAADRLQKAGIDDVLVFGAREKLAISVNSPMRPPKI